MLTLGNIQSPVSYCIHIILLNTLVYPEVNDFMLLKKGEKSYQLYKQLSKSHFFGYSVVKRVKILLKTDV